jgi:ketosteroid isomerase-like protein
MHSEEKQNLELAKRYIRTVGDPSTTFDDLKALLDDQIIWKEMPNSFALSGRTSDLEAASAGWRKGREYLPEQTYTVRHAVASGDSVALEISCSGNVAKAIGPFQAGVQLSAKLAIFLRFRNGRIVSQTDYPCYDPIPAGGK